MRNLCRTGPKDPRQQSSKPGKWKVHDISFSKHQKLLKKSSWAQSYDDLKKVRFFFTHSGHVIVRSRHMSVVISIPDRGGGWSLVYGDARIWDPPRPSRSDFLQVYGLEITLETYRAQKSCLSSEIQPLQVEEVAQNGVLERQISADFRQISALNQDWELADGLDIVVGCRTHYVLHGDEIIIGLIGAIRFEHWREIVKT